mmetsp:Transcript_32755/g.74890  ORF Transcript_32755/g.74890 Transcript_32755/m.74890 type:complete len:331 (-) Transcript_32755:108-1100(-)
MSESVYRKTPLPAKLDLSNRNTADQLKNGVIDDGRGELEGVAAAKTVAKSQQGCSDVMRKDLQAWLAKHGITGPPPSQEAAQRAMWTWIRDFHKEYNDDWWARNMPRLLEQFRPIFQEEMKRMQGPSVMTPKEGSTPSRGQDLLDFSGAPESSPSSVAAVASGSDLLGFDSAPVSAAPTPGAVTDLLIDPLASPAASAVVAPSPAPSASLGGTDLLFGLSAPQATSTSALATPSSVPQASPASASPLLDLQGLLAAATPQQSPLMAAPQSSPALSLSPAAAPAPSVGAGGALDLAALAGALASVQSGAALTPQASPPAAAKKDDLLDLFG